MARSSRKSRSPSPSRRSSSEDKAPSSSKLRDMLDKHSGIDEEPFNTGGSEMGPGQPDS